MPADGEKTRSNLLRILLLEDSAIDAELLASHLERAEFEFEIVRVVNRRTFVESLAVEDIDIILADYSLPDFDGLSALTIARELVPTVPFIFVSGVVGEEFATNAIKRGATDYVMKRNLSRLPTAVERALNEARERADRRKAEDALQQSEVGMRLAVDVAGLGLWEFRPQTGQLHWDARCKVMFGLHPNAEVTYETFLAGCHPDDRARMDAAVQRAVSVESDSFADEYRVITPDGEERWMSTRGQTVFRDGVCERFLGVLRDITEEKHVEHVLQDHAKALEKAVQNRTRELSEQIAERERVEDTLRQMQRLEAVGQLTAGVSHDFNNLLTVILGNVGFVERALEKGVIDDKVRRRLNDMRTAAERGATLTSQLLAFSRRQKLEPKPVDLNETARSMRGLLQSTMGGSVRLETVLKAGLWPALVDPTQIEMILLNLAINARDAMEVGGSVTVETANVTLVDAPLRPEEPTPGDYVMVSVSDTGTGMSDDILARAFEPFFTTKDVGKGSGLGLAQVFGFAKQSGGGVRIETKLGEGTSVKVYLPRASQAARAAAVEAVFPRGDGLANRKILVVDDDSAVREVTATILRELGCVVIEAGSGRAALDALEREEGIDMLLADYAMPGMNGMDTARAARAMRPNLPVLFITGFADLAALKDAGEDRIVQKPFRDGELAAKIEAILGSADAISNVVSIQRGG
ncbi:response regulator [Caulobacter sp. NIBR2454]|uniref:response regulator n=1 Tax=Caulobacter sp. NIBR2454 TaxID=3015996 RepID=UPI0022B612C4|nr:response regulator [Caulobacter sp. NIBR2454]